MSENKTSKNLLVKLSEIQSELKAPKGQYNSFGKYSYRSCEDILEAVKPLTTSRNLVLTLFDEIIMFNGRFYVKATARLIDAESGETIETTALAREPDSKKGMDDSQVTGTASSYARKYALNGLFCIDDAKDADTDAYRNQQNNAPQQKNNAPKNQQKAVSFCCADCGTPFKPTTVKLKDGSSRYMTDEDVYRLSQSQNSDGIARCSQCMNKRNQKG